MRPLVIAAALAAVTLPIGPAPAPANPAPATAAISWQPCPEDPTAECGTLTVPVDWSRPHGPRIDLALARRPATEPSARIGSLVVDPGGPGGSGREFALSGSATFSPEVQRRFDIVGVDRRGVGLSHPIRCSAAALNLYPAALPASQKAFERRVADNRRLRADCRARTGPLFDHVDTLSAARDTEAVRAALGEAKLNYFGLSYGSLLAQQYAELFPDRVGAIVADGVVDHSLDTGRFLDTQAAAVQDAFDQFVAGCERDTACALHGRDVRAVWHGLLARVDRGEIPYPPDPSRPLRAEELIDLAMNLFKVPDWSTLAGFLAALESGEPVLAARRADTVDFPLLAIVCADWSLPIRDHRQLTAHLDRISRTAPDVRYSWWATSLALACLGQSEPVANPQHRPRAGATATPLLLLTARHDPATGYAWAANVARHLGRGAVLVTYEGAGHGVYGRDARTTALVDAYLLTGRAPEAARLPATG